MLLFTPNSVISNDYSPFKMLLRGRGCNHSIINTMTHSLTAYKFFIKKNRTLVFTSILAFKITGDERIELPLKVLETSVIPFDQSPIFNSISNIEK